MLREMVLKNGCFSADLDEVRHLWPRKPYGPLTWDFEAALAWCEKHRIVFQIDHITCKVYFTPAGIYVPAVV
jgi:hypothetical protein